MRDKIKDSIYFKTYIHTNYEIIDRLFEKLNKGIISPNRILPVKQLICSSLLQIMFAKYSLGFDLQELNKDFSNCVKLMDESWVDNYGKVHVKDEKYLDQYYVHIHQAMLQLLSLAYLLNISNKDFLMLIGIIDRDNICDNLYELIIKARFPDRVQKRAEEYDEEHSVILKVYDKLRKVIHLRDKTETIKLIKQFLGKDFYHKNMNLYNSHKSKVNIYCGYWSFEAAAIVKIMNIDDSSFIDQQYYPKDLVHTF